MRLLFQLISQCVLGAIALIVVHFALPGVSLSVNGFLAAIGVFTLAHMILGPFVLSVALHYAAPLAGGVGLVATLLARSGLRPWSPTVPRSAASGPGSSPRSSCG